VVTGLRRGELLGLTWREVRLADPDGPSLRVVRQWVRGRWQTPKSASSARTVPLGPALAEELFRHRQRSPFTSEDERVFCHPPRGSALDHGRYAATLKAALACAGIDRPMRAFHDGRHTALTNAAAAGNPPLSIIAIAGHGSFTTTKT
jgi:integrase